LSTLKAEENIPCLKALIKVREERQRRSHTRELLFSQANNCPDPADDLIGLGHLSAKVKQLGSLITANFGLFGHDRFFQPENE
jgi:hypothetical protein